MTTFAVRGFWLAWGLLLSLIIGMAGGALGYLSGAHAASATMTGAATFSATLTLILLIIGFLTLGHEPPSGGCQDPLRRAPYVLCRCRSARVGGAGTGRASAQAQPR